MSCKKMFLITSVLSVLLAALILRCTIPGDPADPSNTSISIFLSTSENKIDKSFIEDTAGNLIQIGVILHLTRNIDSVSLRITGDGNVVFDTMFSDFPDAFNDTILKDIVFYTPGYKVLTITPFSSLKLSPINATINIIGKEFPVNHKPTISIAGNTVIQPGEPCILTLQLYDSDIGQELAVSMAGRPSGSNLENKLFIWTPPAGFIGHDSVTFIVTDNGLPPLSDTAKVVITVTTTPNHPVIEVIGNRPFEPLQTCSLIVRASDKDPGQTLTVTVSGEPDGARLIDDSLFVWTIPEGFAGEKTVSFKVCDNGVPALCDSCQVTIVVSLQQHNNTAPKWDVKKLTVDLYDTATYHLPLASICSDNDGDPISYSLMSGLPLADTIIGTDYRFKATSGSIGSYNVRIIAVDPDGAGDTLAIELTVLALTTEDNIAPSLDLVAPPNDSIVVETSSYLIDVISNDASGISSVTATIDGSVIPLQASDGGHYTLMIGGLAPGVYTGILLTAADASSAVNLRTKHIYIKYEPPVIDSKSPKLVRFSPLIDSTVVSIPFVTVSVLASDESGIASVNCNFGAFAPTVTSSDSIYSATISGLVANQFNKIRFIATDASGNGNKETLYVIVKYDPSMLDQDKPAMRRNSPVNDSISVSSSSITISIVATDASGIASVVCSFGDATPAVTSSDSIYSATINGLATNQFNRIRFIATDASSNGNKETLYVTLKYDPTMEDNVAPVFTRVNGPVSDTAVATSTINYTYRITDDNGVDKVYWTLNGTKMADLVSGGTNGDEYSFTVTLRSPPHANSIVIHAADKSTNRNKDSAVITLNYNQVPIATPQASLIAKRATALPITLEGTDPDNDPLSGWEIIFGPFNGTITATRPTFSYTPTGNYEGKDSLMFTVSDGISTSEPAKIVITVMANNIAPKIATQPVAATVNKGQSAKFTVSYNSDAYPVPNYIRWVHNNTDTVSGATGLTLSIAAAAYADSGDYKAVIRSTAFLVTPAVSDNVKLTVKDVTAPAITLNGEATVTVNQNGTWSDPGAKATDDRDGTITPTTSGSVDLTKPGSYTLTYTATDKSENSALVTRTVTVIALYTVTYYGNNNTGGTVPATQSFAQGTQATVSGYGTLSRNKFSFAGWNTAQNGTGTQYNPGAKFTMGSSNVNLYAQWSPNQMTLINAASDPDGFQMGEYDFAVPVHTVKFTRNYWIGNTEVTQKAYADLMNAAYGSDGFSYVPNWWEKDKGSGDNMPAYGITWDCAALYCNALTKASGSKDTVYIYTSRNNPSSGPNPMVNLVIDLSRSGFRIPTEAQWEYACRGGKATSYFWGNDTNNISNYVWWADNTYGSYQPVANKLPNNFGLYDMIGNVSEWCHDVYGDYLSGIQTDPTGPSEPSGMYSRVIRGGTINSFPESNYLKCAYRGFHYPFFAGDEVGFRVCLPAQ